MDMKSKCLPLVIFFCIVCTVAAADDGRCPECGKLTMKGASHICKARKQTQAFYYASGADKRSSQSDDKDGKTSQLKQFNVRMLYKRLTCIADGPTNFETSSLIRKWKNRKGSEIRGIWIADCQGNADGIIVQGVDKPRLHKIPLSVLSDEDADYIRKTREESEVARFKFMEMNVPEDSVLGQRFIKAGFVIPKIEGVLFGSGLDEDGECVRYLQLYPSGHICKIADVDVETVSSKIVSGETERNVKPSAAVKGPPFVLEALMSKWAKDVAARKLAEEREERDSEIAAKARMAARREREAKEARERPVREEYKRHSDALHEARIVMEMCNPEKYCMVHKWKECYAPRFGGDYQTEQSKNEYARNYLEALRSQKDGIIKCTCDDSARVKLFKEAMQKVMDEKSALEAMREEFPDVDFSR